MEKVAKPTFVKKDWDGRIFQQLRQEVNETVSKLEPQRKFFISSKAILFPAAYFLVYSASLIWGNNISILFTCYFFMGVLLVINFLNLIHEAVHGTLFKTEILNTLYVHFFD